MSLGLNAKNILITGGTGFIGSNLIQRLLNHDLTLTATYHHKKPTITHKNLTYIQADLTLPSDCQKVCQNQDYVIMCAANSSGAAVMERRPLDLVTPNILMNMHMLEAAYASKVKKFLFISSNSIYPVVSHAVTEEEGFIDHPFEKYFGVAWMKRYSELLCQLYSEKISPTMPCIVVRPANIYGPGDDFDWETAHVLPALMRKVMERQKPIEVWGNGNDVKDFIYIDDFISGLLLALENLETFDPINIASGKDATIREALNEMIKIDAFHEAKIEFDASKPSMIPVRRISTKKAKRLLGFESKTSLREGLAKTMDWYRNRGL